MELGVLVEAFVKGENRGSSKAVHKLHSQVCNRRAPQEIFIIDYSLVLGIVFEFQVGG